MQTPIVPATGTTSGGAGTTALPSGTATIPSLPPSLATALQNGGSIAAQVTARPQAGQLTLTLSGGQSVTVQSPLPLPVGTTLAVALQNAGTPTTLFLQPQTSGQAAAQLNQNALPGGANAASGAAANTAGSAPPQPAVVTTLTQGSIFTATVTAPANATAGTPGQATAATTPQQQANPSGVGQSNAATGGARAAVNPVPTGLPAGSAVQLRLVGFAPQGQPLSGVGTGGTFTGTVTGQTAGGGVSVQSQIGTLSVQLPSTPPNGTQLLLSAVGDPRLPLPGGALGADATSRFQALQNAVALLRGGDPAAAQRLTQGLLPQPNAQLGLAAVFLIGAMRQGGIEKWLGGDGVRALNAAGSSKSGMISRLEGELGQSGRARDAAGQDWRVTSLPLLNDGQLEQIRLYTRNTGEQDHAGEGGAGKQDAKRFVIEADFSRLGPIQLDGLARGGQIDLMVRSHRAFESSERDEIRALFADTVSALGLTGRVDFVVVRAFDLMPDTDLPTSGGFTV